MYYHKDNKTPDYKFKDTIDFTNSQHKEPYNKTYKSLTNVHMGQRKLMLSEIQLLTHYYKTNKTHPKLVYVGAAPGIHLTTLSVMFPHVKFILYDGAKFHESLKRHPSFEIHEGTAGFFTDDTCREIKTRFNSNNLIFVSDIRLGENDFEEGVERDMAAQKKWVEMLKPKLSLLKFRMSYNMKHGDKLNYIKGELLYGIWPKQLSGETRLLIEQANVKKNQIYDFKDYEEIMFYHNKHKRPFCLSKIPTEFSEYITSKNNIYCSCYDCILELSILNDYCQSTLLFSKPLADIINIFGTAMNWQKRVAFQNKKDAVKQPLQAL
jgi:hypothetical protein